MTGGEASEVRAVAGSLKARVLFSLGYGCGLRAGEVVRLKVKHIDRAQNIIRVEQSRLGRAAKSARASCRPRRAAREALSHVAPTAIGCR
jgi:integrase